MARRETRPLIIVTDAASLGDDAVAIAMLVRARRFDIKLVVATSGNVWADQVALNARNLLAQLHREDIRVCVGTPSSAFQDRWTALHLSATASSELHYVGAFAREIPTEAEEGRCRDLFEFIAAADRPDLLIIGPSSPIASIVRTHRNLAENVGRVFLMGGAVACDGNVTSAAEFNFWFDPEAAETLLASDLPITLLPLDAIRTLHYSAEFAARLDPAHPVTKYIQNTVGNPRSLTACDEALAAVMLDANVTCGRKMLKLSVETKPGPGYGAVNVLDENAGRRPVEVITGITESAFWHLAHRTLLEG
jgi:pyrimidine-specific ribonucleoside hydrolase